jgi:hypothetical protein
MNRAEFEARGEVFRNNITKSFEKRGEEEMKKGG